MEQRYIKLQYILTLSAVILGAILSLYCIFTGEIIRGFCYAWLVYAIGYRKLLKIVETEYIDNINDKH